MLKNIEGDKWNIEVQLHYSFDRNMIEMKLSYFHEITKYWPGRFRSIVETKSPITEGYNSWCRHYDIPANKDWDTEVRILVNNLVQGVSLATNVAVAEQQVWDERITSLLAEL